jgi:hypothetical protein
VSERSLQPEGSLVSICPGCLAAYANMGS